MPEMSEALEKLKYKHATLHFDHGSYEEAARLFTEVLYLKETADCWNDWATAQMLCQRGFSAARGYRKALELEPSHHQAAANLGIVLTGLGQFQEAISLLEESLNGVDGEQRVAVTQLLAHCRKELAARNEAEQMNTAKVGQLDAAPKTDQPPKSGADPHNGNQSTAAVRTATVKHPQSREEVLAAVNTVPNWWHCIELPFGVTTPGQVDHRDRVEAFGLPSDLTGKTVLDVGCLNGFWSFEAEKRKAQHVLAIDAWDSNWPCDDKGFRTAHALLGSRVKLRWVDLFDLTPEKHGRFDLVMCFGVLYHLRQPLRGLERLAKVCKEHLILETAYDPAAQGRTMEFFEQTELCGDPTNWWKPSLDCVMAMLRSCGFSGVRPVHTYGDRVVIHAFAPGRGGAIRQVLARFGEDLVSYTYQAVVGRKPGSSLEESLADLPIDLFGKLKQKVLEGEGRYRAPCQRRAATPEDAQARWANRRAAYMIGSPKSYSVLN